MTDKRTFQKRPAVRCYNKPQSCKVDEDLYERLSVSANQNITQKLTIPAKTALAVEVKAGQTCRVVTSYGPQVADVNFWNLANPRERLFSGKTRAIHRAHLTIGDRLWSTFPFLRPLATITQDSLSGYGVDEDGCSLHDVIGTRCDPYTHKLMTGKMATKSCHQSLMAAVQPWGLGEDDIHDVFNIFMCTGLNEKQEYIVKSSPTVAGDYIEWLAEVDLLVAISACPHGDVSVPCGEVVPDDICRPLDVLIGQPDSSLLQEWRATSVP